MVAAKKGEVVVGVQTHLKNIVKPKKKQKKNIANHETPKPLRRAGVCLNL